MMLPGTHLLAFASRWFDPATSATVFEPLVADWQREWLDAEGAHRPLVRGRGFVSFSIAALASTPALLRARAPKALTAHIVRRIVIATGLATAVLMIPFVREIEPTWRQALLLLFVMPSSLVLAFPFAMIWAVDTVRRFPDLEPHVARATVAKLALVAFVFMFVCHGWVMPAANHLYREAAWQAHLPAWQEARTAKLPRPIRACVR